jgi:hypothetical protein
MHSPTLEYSMRRLNIKITSAFDRDLKKYMEISGIENEANAIHAALRNVLLKPSHKPKVPLRDLLGIGLTGEPSAQCKWLTENDLWEKNGA